jgi:hypothetical protein
MSDFDDLKVLIDSKTPYRDGTTQVALETVDFIARLAALIPKPRINLTRYHGVLAPNHRSRGLITPAKRGKDVKRISTTGVGGIDLYWERSFCDIAMCNEN